EHRRALDRQTGRVLSLQNAINVVGEPPIGFRKSRSVGAQSASVRIFRPTRDNRDAQSTREVDYLLTICTRYRVGKHDDRLRWFGGHAGIGSAQLGSAWCREIL